MLVNTLDAIEPVAGGLEHVQPDAGATMVYGAHLGPFKTPARESDPPHMPPEFNVDQQQFLERRQLGKFVDMVGDQTLGRLRIRTG